MIFHLYVHTPGGLAVAFIPVCVSVKISSGRHGAIWSLELSTTYREYWMFLSTNNALLQNKCVASMYPTLSWKPSLFFHISCYDKNSLLVVTLNDASARFKSSSCNQHFSLNWKRFSYQSSHFQRWWCIDNNWFPEEVFCAMCLALPYFIAPRRQPWIYHRFCPLFSSHLDLDLEYLWSM